MGGKGGAGTNPEQLFAAGYAACFHSAVKFVAMRQKLDTADSTVTARVGIGRNDSGGFSLSVDLAGHRCPSSTARRRRSSWRPPTRCARTATRRGATSRSRSRLV